MFDRSAAALVALSDRLDGCPSGERARALLAAARPTIAEADLDAFSLGQRDAVLSHLYAELFGTRIDGVVVCAECGESLDISLELPARTSVPFAPLPAELQSVRIDADDDDAYAVHVRCIQVGDLRALPADPTQAIRLVLARCALAVSRGGETVSPAELPDSIVEAISNALERIDADADDRIRFSCAACGASGSVSIDIGAFFAARLASVAQAALADVHLLASAYGWSEHAIFALSERRRRRYVALAGA